MNSSINMSLGPMCFFNYYAAEQALRRGSSCDICGTPCSRSLRHKCEVCPEFDICTSCFTAQEFSHEQGHFFSEIDLAYLLAEFRSTTQGCYDHGILIGAKVYWPFVRPGVSCPTCFDHRPGQIHSAWIIEHGSDKKLLDAATLSEDQRHMWRNLQEQTSLSEPHSFFLLDRYHWNMADTKAGFQDDFQGDFELMGTNIQEVEGSDSWMSKHIIFMSDLARSGEKGCQLCSLIYRSLAIASPSTVSKDSRMQLLISSTDIRVVDSDHNRECSSDYWKWILQPLPGTISPWSCMESGPELNSHFASEQSFKTLRTWIQDCESHHPHQHCSGEAQSLPSRLLALENEQGDPTLHLVEPPSGTRGRYIALSHCWGTIPIITTTSTNITARRQIIASDELPVTFRETINLARKLKIPYLWIDSLCIIQDSALDWETESAKMCDYYRNAWLVVITASAKGDTEGFLKNRPAMYQGIPLESQEGSGVHDMSIRHTHSHISEDVFSRTDQHGDYTRARAWCMQETMLARRSIAFHRAELVWACHTKSDCECGRASFDYNLGKISSQHVRDIHFRFATARADVGHYQPQNFPGSRFSDPSLGWSYTGRPFSNVPHHVALFEEWRAMIVPLYTKRQMTKRTDRFPALSGLAQFVGAQQSGRYLAGIWERDIQLGLLWEVTESRRGHAAPSDSLAPSFSWASVDRPIVYHLPGFAALEAEDFSLLGDVRVQLLGDDVEVAGKNEYGQVSKGSITLRGLVSQVLLLPDDGALKIRTYNETGITEGPECQFEHSSFQADTCIEQTTIADEAGAPITTMRRSRKSKSTMPDSGRIVLDCLVVADIRTPSRPTAYRRMDVNCDECALLILGRKKFENECWYYERLGKAVLVFEPGAGKQWLSKAKSRKIVLC